MSFKNKPGSALASLIPDWIVSTKKSCSCKDYERKMNRWGTDGCEQRIESICEYLANQDENLISVLRNIPRGIKLKTAKTLVQKAINLSR